MSETDTNENTKPKARSSDPRTCAICALQWVFAKHQPLEHFYEKDAAFLALPERDRALTRAIVGTSLRNLGQIDAILAKVLDRPLPKKAVAAQQILRAGLAELLFLRSAAHGVVHSLVQLAGHWRAARHYKGLINAVFRRITRDGPALLADVPVLANIPPWPGEIWDEVYGPGTRARAAQIMREPPSLDLTLLRADPDIITALDGTDVGPQSIRLAKGRVEELPGYQDGTWIVQDISAALPVQILNPKPGEQIADLCAAPGGKTMQLAAKGAKVWAIDTSAARILRLEENLKRTQMSAELICADAVQWKPAQKLDAVLLDAPCSATGIFRHHPDVLYNRRAKDIEALAIQQAALAQNAAYMLQPGGRMVYCVCSAEQDEGEAIIETVLANTDLVLDAIDPGRAGIAADFVTNGMIRIPPGAQIAQGAMDAFFIARLRKP